MKNVVRINNPNISVAGGFSTTETGLIKLVSFANSPDAIYGSGADGSATISSNTTISRDMFYYNLTVNTNIVLNLGGYRLFVKNNLTVYSGTVIGYTTGFSTAGSIAQGGATNTSVTASLGGASATQTVTAPTAAGGGTQYYAQPNQAVLGYAITASQTTATFLRGGAGGTAGPGGGVVVLAARYIIAGTNGASISAPGTAGSGGGGGGAVLVISTSSSLPAGVSTNVTAGAGCNAGTATYMQLI